MICPECGEALNDDSNICKNCGADIGSGSKGAAKKKSLLKSKLIFAAVFCVVLIIAVILIIALLTVNKGQKTAEKLVKGLGKPISEVSNSIDYPLNKQSSYEFLHSIDSGNYICNSNKEISVEGINVPEWAVFCATDSNDVLMSVSFYDFTKLEKCWKGIEENGKIDFSDVEEGIDYKDFEDIIDVKPYIIIYTEKSTAYEYRYYYEDVNKNETCYLIRAEFDSNDELISFNAQQTDFSEVIFGNYQMLCGNFG